MRALSLLFLVAAMVMALPARTGAARSQTFISGGGLREQIRLAPVDEAAFFQRLSFPPKLDHRPEVSGVGYKVKSSYWPMVLPGNGSDRPAALDEAFYFMKGGFVVGRQGGSDAWLSLDLRQRAILDRYIRLGEKGLIAGEPSLIDVIRASVATGEDIGTTIGSRVLDQSERTKLLTAMEGLEPRPLPSPSDPVPTPAPLADLSNNSAWIIFTFPEGRDARLLYTDITDVLVDETAQQFYAVTRDWLAKALGPSFQPGSPAIAPAPVPKDEGPGAPFWWVIMIGGGVALIAAAVYLSRGWANRHRA